jgi:hypothetical protein
MRKEYARGVAGVEFLGASGSSEFLGFLGVPRSSSEPRSLGASEPRVPRSSSEFLGASEFLGPALRGVELLLSGLDESRREDWTALRRAGSR